MGHIAVLQYIGWETVPQDVNTFLHFFEAKESWVCYETQSDLFPLLCYGEADVTG